MRVEMRFNHVQWFDKEPVVFSDGKPIYAGADGMVDYECKVFYTDEEAEAKNKVLNPWTLYLQQPFQRSGLGKTPDGRNVWAWDGDRESPSLTPSFACQLEEAYVHIYFTKGKIVDKDSRNVTFP